MEKFNETINALCAVFDRKVSKELVKAYQFALRNFDEDQLVAAGAELMNGQYFPKPYDFIQLISPDAPPTKDCADAAWSRIKDWAFCGGEIPNQTEFRAMRGVCDKYMIMNADERELKSYGFSFRSAYLVNVEREKNAETRERIEGGGEMRRLL